MNALLPLALLACPIGMGLMMWFMARGMRGGQTEQRIPGDSLPDLKAEQARLAEKIEALERDHTAEALEREETAEALEPDETTEKPTPADVR